VNAREVLAELDLLGISIFYRRPGPDLDPDTRVFIGMGGGRAYPELVAAMGEHTPTLLKIGRFEESRHTPGTYVRRPGGAA
jgi:hypothetical protein